MKRQIVFALTALMIGCTPITSFVDSDDTAADTSQIDTAPPEPIVNPFTMTADVYVWVGGAEDDDTCEGEGPCLDYVRVASFGYGDQIGIEQWMSWPVYVKWTADTPITVPGLGLDEPTVDGEVYFNPWEPLKVAWCNEGDCLTTVSFSATRLASRDDCIDQEVDGIYEAEPYWGDSNGEAYGVDTFGPEECSSWTCTTRFPEWACENNDDPHEDCDEYGCQCNVDSWTPTGAREVRYDASVTADAGVESPWLADRWETGGMHGVDPGVVYRMYTEVKLSGPGIVLRPVIDVRDEWSGTGSWPLPDGAEGPPIFTNEVNAFIAPDDGYFPLEWETTATVDDTWAQPVWNFMVHNGGESRVGYLRNLAFQGCGEDIAPVTCSDGGCTY